MPNNLMSVISNPKSSGKKLDRLFIIREDTIQNPQRIYGNQKPKGGLGLGRVVDIEYSLIGKAGVTTVGK